MHRSEWQLWAETLLKLLISLTEAEALSPSTSATGVQTCYGGCTSATRGCRCRDSCWQRQAADVIDLSEAKQPLHINPPRPQAYKYQHATGWDSVRTAADLRVSAPTSCLRLSLCPDASIQLCPTCPAPPAAAGPDLQRRVAGHKREGKRTCQKPDVRVRVWVKGEDGDFSLGHV